MYIRNHHYLMLILCSKHINYMFFNWLVYVYLDFSSTVIHVTLHYRKLIHSLLITKKVQYDQHFTPHLSKDKLICLEVAMLAPHMA